jgi:pimeloyl-ACP methyl ester carboxylesterase
MSETANPTSHSYFSQRLRLHYLDWGNAEAPHMLMVHGMRDHCHTWDWMAQHLRQDYHIVAPDLRGHGDSAWVMGSSYSHLDYVYDLAQLIRQAKLEPVTLVAHSLGGTLACQLRRAVPGKDRQNGGH